jgi:pimeloyl-ACP methyl ester carboxylesterase
LSGNTLFRRRRRAVLFGCLLILSTLLLAGLFNVNAPASAAELISASRLVFPANAVAQLSSQILPLDVGANADPPGLQHLTLAGYKTTVYAPPTLRTGEKTQLLIALHGLGGNGDNECQGLLDFARQNKIVVLAPSLFYNQDWHNPKVIAEEDSRLSGKLNQMESELSQALHLPLKSRALVYGMSRGAQLAHRYALLYPEKVLGVAGLAAGSYTLPFASYKDQPLNFPFGVADFNKYTGKLFNLANFVKVNFWLAVGEQDNDPNVTPQAWNPYIGLSRYERAHSFYSALKQTKLNVQLTTFPGTGHDESQEMRAGALKFFKSLEGLEIVSDGSVFFPDTGHSLGGVFKKYWQAHGGLAQFGYPLTEPQRERNPDDGQTYLVQYFERARFEYHPEFAGTENEVELGLLGRLVAPKVPPITKDSAPADGIYFAETGHSLSGIFLKYWQARGGLAIYGYPLTEPFQEKNRDDGKVYLVQYFERNRFEWHPDYAGTENEILLGLLGSYVLQQRGY